MERISDYLHELNAKFIRGDATEHSYRPVLENYLVYLFNEQNKSSKKIIVTNEPKRQSCGAPDYTISKKLDKSDVPIGYIEAKDIGINLNKTDKSEQLIRYKESLDNLILTDYIDFIFYENNQQYAQVKIAEIKNGKIIPIRENFAKLEDLLLNFAAFSGQTIKSPQKLASIMAKKAKLMKESFAQALKNESLGITQQFKVFKEVLMHDVTAEQFADLYATTVTYGLFTARMHDKSLDDFSRTEAYELIPKNNPFLQQLFLYIAVNIDDEIKWVVDDLCEVFRYANVLEILKNFGKSSGRHDPIVHFYEDFLKEFDPKTKKTRGIWYTPASVVNFIVKAIDEILKTHFGLVNGIADNTKIKVKRDIAQVEDKRTKSGKAQEEREVHKVQMLDIATGTGTFIAQVIRQIYEDNFQNQQGMWSAYVDEDLLPRLHGFEFLMTSYAICHLKIEMLLKETAYKPTNPSRPKRLGVYLTNSLDSSYKEHEGLFASFLSDESKAASRIKNETPVMVAFGNPPYSVSSQNKSEWISDLIGDYKKDLNERKTNLDDDYIKFIRMSEYYINKTGYGIVGVITNNSFLDGVTHRQMRRHLLETFDSIYVYDLHGNSRKNETCPDGSKDENVFDVMVGVSICIFVKDGKKTGKLATVWHYDSFGKRQDKYDKLLNNSLRDVPFKKLNYQKPYYFFVPKDFKLQKQYDKCFSIKELFTVYNSGIQTKRDKITIQFTHDIMKKVIKDFCELNEEELKEKYNIKNNAGWKVSWAKSDVNDNIDKENVYQSIAYRPYDMRYTFYTGKTSGFYGRPRYSTMKHMLAGDNVGLMTSRSFPSNQDFDRCFITKNLADLHSASDQTYVFPLYLYDEDELGSKVRRANFNSEIIKAIADKLGLQFIDDDKFDIATTDSSVADNSAADVTTSDVSATELKSKDSFNPLNLLDYIYAVLHCPNYRKKYHEFLKIDFPKIPYTTKKEFWYLVALGSKLRKLHLLEGDEFNGINNLIAQFPIEGNNIVDKINQKSFVIDPNKINYGKVYINETQYFDNVPRVAWQFFIGGYVPAQKWLKDRRNRELSYKDILHYQKMILSLYETDKVMQEIDKISL